jgi:glycerol transport system ATP-binding protein|tara:strand:- start:717 stop:1805 length:1089 start_codon:yes stop_codon:yes gene_type:complete
MSLKLEAVTKQVGRQTHLHAMSLEFDAGSLNVLLGPTLSGKTSLMRMMAGLDRPSSGRLFMNGEDVTGVPVQRRNVAMVYQQFINYPVFTVYDNIASPLRLARTPRAEIDRKVREAAELLKLTPMLERMPLELSGGQQQRTALARALVKQAELVLLDEPLANLDYKLREELRAELPRIFEASGAIFVYATTEPSEALLLGGNTVCLHQGQATHFGPTLELYRQPNSLLTAMTMSDPPLNTKAVTKKGDQLIFSSDFQVQAGTAAAGLADGRYTVGFRPYHLYLDRNRQEWVRFSAKVAVSEITGSESFIHIDAFGERWVALAHGVRNVDVDQTIELFLDPTQFFLFAEDGTQVAVPDATAKA